MPTKVAYVAFAQTAATAEADSAVQTNYDHPGLKVVFNVTVFGSGVTLTLQGRDKLSGQFFTILAGSEVAANTATTYTVFPGVTPSSVALSQILPEQWRIKVAPTAFAVTAVSTGSKKFTVAGDQTARFLAGATVRVSGSTGNDGLYTVVSSTFGTATDIVVSQAVPSAVADGSLVSAAAYTAGCHLIP